MENRGRVNSFIELGFCGGVEPGVTPEHRTSTEAESPVAKKQRNGTDERDAGGG